MNLLDLLVRIGVEDDASEQMSSISSAMIAKGQLIADAIKSALSTAFSAVKDFLTSAVNVFSEYEQQVGGMETLFKSASDTVIQNAQNAYKTAGMSANEYMSTVSSFAMSLITSVSQRRAQALSSDTATEQQENETRYNNLKATLDKQLQVTQRAMQRAATARQRQLQDEYDELSRALSRQVEARQEALNEEYSQLQKELQKQVKARQEQQSEELENRRNQLQDEYDALRETLDKETDAFRDATDAHIKEINREYNEKLKLIDEDEYKRLKQIDDQIDALNDQTEAERRAAKERQQQEKVAELEYQSMYAASSEDRRKAAKDLADLLAQIEQEKREQERKDQIEYLRDQREVIRQEADKRREDAKLDAETETETYKESRDAQLKELQSSHARQLKEQSEHNSKILKELSKQHSDEIEAMQEANEAVLKERQKANQQEIKAMQEHNQQVLKEKSRANEDIMTSLRESQQDQLAEMKAGHAKRLEELKKELSEMEKAQDGYVKATDEDYAEAARIADRAIIDMSDNANKYGTSIEMLQNAYQGFSRDNFTMLDNLKLGYGQTREEMQRLLDDAEKIKASQGEAVEYSITSFADIVEAIHTIQAEYEVSGYTVDELTQKLKDQSLTEQDLQRVAQDLGISYEEVADRMQKGTLTANDAIILTGTTSYEASETIQGAMNSAKGAWENWLVALADPSIPVEDKTKELMEKVGNAAGLIIPRVREIISELLTYLNEHKDEIMDTLKSAFEDAVPEDMRADIEEVQTSLDTFFSLCKTGVDIVTAIGNTISWFGGEIQGILDIATGFTQFLNGVPNLIYAAFTGDEDKLNANGRAIINGFVNGAENTWDWEGKGFFQNIGDWIKANKGPEEYDLKLLEPAGRNIITGLINGSRGNWDAQKSFFSGLGGTISGFFNGSPNLLTTAGSNIINSLKNGATNVWPNVSQWFGGLKGNVEGFFNGSGSWLTGHGGNIMSGLYSGLTNVWQTISGFIGQLPNMIIGVFQNTGSWLVAAGHNIITGFWNGMTSAWKTVADWISGIGQWIADHKGPKEYDLGLLVANGQWIIKGLGDGLKRSFEGDIVPYVSGMADRMQGAFGVPVLTAGGPAYLTQSNADASQTSGTGPLTVIFEVDGNRLGELVYDLTMERMQRVGTRLVEEMLYDYR